MRRASVSSRSKISGWENALSSKILSTKFISLPQDRPTSILKHAFLQIDLLFFLIYVTLIFGVDGIKPPIFLTIE